MATPREVITADMIAAGVARVGKQISAAYAGKNVVLVGMLKGATVFLADLLRATSGNLRFELVHVDQRPGERGAVIELTYATKINLGGVHALILKDVCHSGVTENYVRTHLAEQGPASLEVVALVDRPLQRRVALEPKYVVFSDVPDGRLVGYGMEYQGQWGNLSGLNVLDDV
jgi:hypoxanthine phosphoribosyltransferase